MEEHFKNLNEKLENMSQNQEKILSSMEEIKGKMENLEINSSDQQNELLALRNANFELKREIAILKANQEKQLQQNKANALEIKGIKKQKNENLHYIFFQLMSALELDISSLHVNSIYRFKSNEIIYVNMIRHIDQQEIIKQAKPKRLTTSVLNMIPKNNIYINEAMTPNTAKLFHEARKFREEFGIKFIWIRSGNIFMKRHEKDSTLSISSLEDLDELRNHLKAVNNQALNADKETLSQDDTLPKDSTMEVEGGTTVNDETPVIDHAQNSNDTNPLHTQNTTPSLPTTNTQQLPSLVDTSRIRMWAQSKTPNRQTRTANQQTSAKKRLRSSPHQ